MENKFLNNTFDKPQLKSFLKNICNCKVGFYSVGLYPASLAYNCAMHSKDLNILLAPRPGRKLLGAFSADILSTMDSEVINRIMSMALSTNNESDEKYNTLDSLILKCDIVILASNSNHIQDDIELAIKLKERFKRENVVLACLVGSFCIDKNKKPFILCEKYPDLAFFTGFHRHGALRNKNDSFSANFCHPDSLTAYLGTEILNNLSPKIRVSGGVHNIECQYIKAIKNISSIFAGFANKYHSDKPGMLPTINTVLLSQCFDQAANVSSLTREQNKVNHQFVPLKELGYGADLISAKVFNKNKIMMRGDYTFSQLNAVTADVIGSMSLPTIGKPTRNFQAGQVLSEMLFSLKRCPKDLNEFIFWCNKFSLSQGSLEGIKSLKFWPHIYKKYSIYNNTCSMINLIYLCFYANDKEKENIYQVLTNEREIINFCQESVKPITKKQISRDIFEVDNPDDLYENNKIKINKNDFTKKDANMPQKINAYKDEKYVVVIKLINKYFSN